MFTPLLISGIAACATGALFAALLAKPLHGVLDDACASARSGTSRGRSASFWTAYSSVMMLLAPALGVLFMAAFPAKGLAPEVMFSRSLFYGLLCLIVALLVIAQVIGRTAFRQMDAELRERLLTIKKADVK